MIKHFELLEVMNDLEMKKPLTKSEENDDDERVALQRTFGRFGINILFSTHPTLKSRSFKNVTKNRSSSIFRV